MDSGHPPSEGGPVDAGPSAQDGGPVDAGSPDAGPTPLSDGGHADGGSVADAGQSCPAVLASLSLGNWHSCALGSDGQLKCWGANFIGGLGDGTDQQRNVATRVAKLDGGVSNAGLGAGHSCAVAEGRLYCWGQNDWSQLGLGAGAGYRLVPEQVALGTSVQQVEAGADFTCALANCGSLYCWGHNNFGQAGLGPAIALAHVPVAVTLPRPAKRLVAGGTRLGVVDTAHACVIADDDSLYCWGSNYTGQLGDGTTTQRSQPTRVLGLDAGVKDVAVGGAHTCAVLSHGGVKCWGRGADGALGTGLDAGAQRLPTDVLGLDAGAVRVAAGDRFTCVITTAGTVKCWGEWRQGQLGNGPIDFGLPVDLQGLDAGASTLAAGGEHACARVGATVQCWGGNGYGQLGNGDAGASVRAPGDVLGL